MPFMAKHASEHITYWDLTHADHVSVTMYNGLQCTKHTLMLVIYEQIYTHFEQIHKYVLAHT